MASSRYAWTNEEPKMLPLKSEEFSIAKLFLCTWHGNLSRKPGRVIEATSTIPNANFLTPWDLKTLVAIKTKPNLFGDEDRNERYRCSKMNISNFTVTDSTSSTALATFRVPANLMNDALITFHPSANDSTPSRQRTFFLYRTNRHRFFTSRSHAFVHNSAIFTWFFVSGMEIILRDSQSRVHAKFFHAPSWFQSGGLLAMGNDLGTIGPEGGTGTAGTGTETAEPEKEIEPATKIQTAEDEDEDGDEGKRQQEEDSAKTEWEQVVVVTLLACLRREREWRYSVAGLVFPFKRTVL